MTNQLTPLHPFPDGERDFESAMAVEEYVVPVTVHPDGDIVAEKLRLRRTHEPRRRQGAKVWMMADS